MECEKVFLTHIKEEEEIELPKLLKVNQGMSKKGREVDEYESDAGRSAC
jgi:hypothetical protein